MNDGSAQPDAAREVAVAASAAEHGDLAGALHHVGEALVQDPGCVQAHMLLHDLATTVATPLLELVPVQDHMTAQAVVVRACLQARWGRLSEAVGLLAELALHVPDTPVGELARAWLSRDPDAPAKLDPLVLLRCGSRWMQRWPDGVEDPLHRLALEPFLEVWGRVLTANPSHGAAHWAASSMARRLGRHDLSVAWARWAVDVQPDDRALVMLAYALSDAGRSADAEEALRRAVELTPSDPRVRVDLAELLCRSGRVQEGMAELDRVLRDDPEHARARAVAARWL